VPYDLPDHALIDMGDFVGGTLKHLRAHSVARLTIAGGFAKLANPAGHLDLHSAQSRVDATALGEMLAALGADNATVATTRAAAGAAEILALAGSWKEALARLAAARAGEVAIVDREGEFLARVGA
jgi:cobalt-precorrin-5B (C1)-methyltransferase